MARRIEIADTMDKAAEIKLIADFVAALPKDTYLYMMLKQLPKYCEVQIENDWGMDPVKSIDELNEQLSRKDKTIDEINGTAKNNIDQLKRDRDNFQRAANEWQQEYTDMEARALKAEATVRENEAFLAAAAMQVQALKAQLYDYLMADRQGAQA
jgi:chromosome segregation ATPase